MTRTTLWTVADGMAVAATATAGPAQQVPHFNYAEALWYVEGDLRRERLFPSGL